MNTYKCTLRRYYWDARHRTSFITTEQHTVATDSAETAEMQCRLLYDNIVAVEVEPVNSSKQ